HDEAGRAVRGASARKEAHGRHRQGTRHTDRAGGTSYMTGDRRGRPRPQRGYRDRRGHRPAPRKQGPRRRPTRDPARRAAFDALRAVTERDAYANLILPELLRQRRITGRDAALATELTY